MTRRLAPGVGGAQGAQVSARVGLAVALALAIASNATPLDRWAQTRAQLARIAELTWLFTSAGALACAEARAVRLGADPRRATVAATAIAVPLASWQTIGGCGAGSATGIGGIKWIGRNVRGGVVNVQCQANYTQLGDGHTYTVNNQIAHEVNDALMVGVVVPYLYKWLDDPFKAGFDISNGGLGDVNLMLTGRFGPIKATSVSLSLGAPTGSYDVAYGGNLLPQDRQLGSGSLSAGVLLDHVIDQLWGPIVLGASGTYPGAANRVGNFRAPSAAAYAYAGYLFGPLVPAIGASATRFFGDDLDLGLPNLDRPSYMAALNASLELSTDWLALLAGVSLPYGPGGRQPWTVGLGLSMAPF